MLQNAQNITRKWRRKHFWKSLSETLILGILNAQKFYVVIMFWVDMCITNYFYIYTSKAMFQHIMLQ